MKRIFFLFLTLFIFLFPLKTFSQNCPFYLYGVWVGRIVAMGIPTPLVITFYPKNSSLEGNVSILWAKKNPIKEAKCENITKIYFVAYGKGGKLTFEGIITYFPPPSPSFLSGKWFGGGLKGIFFTQKLGP
jgi:hypothetical protein